MIRDERVLPRRAVTLTVADHMGSLPDLVLARQPTNGDEAATAAVAYADAHAPNRITHERFARAAYRTVVAYDAAAVIGNAEDAPNQTYDLGVADLHALMAGEPSAIELALADR